MWTIDQLKKRRDLLQDWHSHAKKAVDKLNEKVVKLEADQTLRPESVRDQIRSLRDQAFNEIGSASTAGKGFQDMAAEILAQERYWGSKQYLLSKQRFDVAPEIDSAIGARYQREMAGMDTVTLSLAIEDAIAEENLPVVWQGWLAAQRRAGEPGLDLPDLSRVSIPGQDEALQVIKEAGQINALSTILVGQASGRLKPTDVITLARAGALAA